MAKKIKKSIPWLVFMILASLIVGAGFASFWPVRVPEVRADVATSTVQPTVEVGNATPTISEVSLNAGNNITLTENTSKSVNCTLTAVDQNGGSDIISATTTIYRSGVASSCADDDNNCYQTITPSATSSSGDYFYATFTENIWFHAEPTDVSAPTYSTEHWECYVVVEDSYAASTSTTNTAETIEMGTLDALIITSSINYQTLAPGATSSASQETTATTTGNAAIDVKLKGTADFTSGANSFDASQQEYATSSVAYGTGTALATTTYATLELESLKPVQHDPIQATATDIIYWRIGIPEGQAPGTYNSTTSAAAVLD